MICCFAFSPFTRTASSLMSLFSQEFWFWHKVYGHTVYWTILSPCLNYLWSGQLVAFFCTRKIYVFLMWKKYVLGSLLCVVMELSLSTGLWLSHGNKCFWTFHGSFWWLLQENTLLLALSVIWNGQKLSRCVDMQSLNVSCMQKVGEKEVERRIRK